MKIALDTNFLASAFGTRGICAEILERMIRLDYQLIISSLVLVELEEVLLKKFKVPKNKVGAVLLYIPQIIAIVPKSTHKLEIPIKDEDDILILRDIAQEKASYFVTGDKELLQLARLARLGKMKILSPKDFWLLIK